MPISNCPRCQRRIIFEKNTQDFSHECDSKSDVMDNEDVVVVGNWEDYTGSKTNVGNVMFQGGGNALFGTRAWIEGEDDDEETRRGNKVVTHRQRAHHEFIKLQGGGR